jgi:hypothetical protein
LKQAPQKARSSSKKSLNPVTTWFVIVNLVLSLRVRGPGPLIHSIFIPR